MSDTTHSKDLPQNHVQHAVAPLPVSPISTLIEMVAKYDSVRCSDGYCEVSIPLGHERHCIASNAPFCEFHFVEVHRPDCGYCTLHLEQQRESILKGVPTLDLERWADDQQSGPMGAVVDGDRLLPQSYVSGGVDSDTLGSVRTVRDATTLREGQAVTGYPSMVDGVTPGLSDLSRCNSDPLTPSIPCAAPDDPEGKIGDLL